jgi:hypothetical protein
MAEAGNLNRKSCGLGSQHVVAAFLAQNAVLEFQQLLALGVSADRVHHGTKTAQIFRVYRAVYSICPPSLLSLDGRYTAAVLAAGDGATVSVLCGAGLLGTRKSPASRIDITIPHRGRRKIPGVTLHRSTTLAEQDVTLVRGLRCTTVARTSLDCADVLDLDEMKRMFEQEEAMGCFDLGALQDQIDRNPKRPAAKRLTAALADYTFGFGVPFSEFERAMRGLCAAFPEIPEPIVNGWINPGDGELMIQPDFQWPQFKIVVETDGERYHRAMGKRERDYRNRQRLMAAGWRPLPLTYRQVTREQSRLAATVITMIRATPPTERTEESRRHVIHPSGRTDLLP